jgi:beta-glucosidase
MRKSWMSCLIVFLLVALSFGQAPKPDSRQIEQQVNAIVGKMTLEQKIDMIGGINGFDVRGYPEFNLPLLHTADGPIGVRNDGPATTMAGGISLASTWDPALAERVGQQIGRDARSKGKHFLLGPS